MDYGFAFLSTVDIADEVALAEHEGFTHAWLYDTQMLCADVFQCLALCTQKTRNIKLGTNVTNPASRIAPVTANNFATLNLLAPGRVVMGIGTGNTARRTLGMPAASLSQLREHVEICRGLLAGETVPYQEGERRRMIRFLNQQGDWINLKDPVPIYIAASGPKALELAGEIADGVILFGAVGDSLLDYTLSHVRLGAERVGRKLSDLYIMLSTACHVTQPGENLRNLQAAVGAYVTSQCNIFALSARDPTDLPADVRDDIMAFRNAYRTPDAPIETRHLDLYSGYVNDFKDEHAALVTSRMIQATTLTGTTAEIGARIAALEAAGVNQIAIHGGSRERLGAVIREFAAAVIRRPRTVS
ncbi:MAG: LLM class flavin-dependent oxidoreductase [Gammaproteobacteria bacterium]|nr:LLM class flavin-dependent oxidoreductase [Gammaproteobacteria bacterium]